MNGVLKQTGRLSCRRRHMRKGISEGDLKIALPGIVNILLKDEGVSLDVVNAMKERCTFSPEVEIIDGGTPGLDLLPFIEGKEGLLIIDAVNFGKAPGYIGILENEDIPSRCRL
jgi:hydrogenase maturation protease